MTKLVCTTWNQDSKIGMGSARVSRASSGVAPELSSPHSNLSTAGRKFVAEKKFVARSFRRDAENDTPEACAPRIETRRPNSNLKSRLKRCVVLLAALFVLALAGRAQTAFVYDTGGEILTSGDFNGDGLADVLVLDKSTGNARAGYLATNGVIAWSAPLVSGVENVSGAAVGKFLTASADSLAVTAPGLNRVNLISLSNSNNAGTPVVITPNGIGPHTLVTLLDPLGPGSLAPTLLIASSDNAASGELLESLQISSGVPTAAGTFSETAEFDRGNALAPANSPTLAAGLVRGDSDRFDLLQFTNPPGGVLISLTNLPPGGDYVFGNFNGEALPRIIFYQTVASNLTAVALVTNSSGLAFDTNISISLTEAAQHVFYLPSGFGTALIQFSDGVQALQFPGGTPALAAIYRGGLASTNNVFSGLIPFANGQFVLLDAAAGSLASAHAQVVKFDGTNFTPVSASSLPATTTRATRANLWLFQNEPFVNGNPGFVASFSSPDWSDAIVNLLGTISVASETDAGAGGGLNSAATNNLGATPAGANFALANQYRDAISVFSYAAPRAAEPVIVTISPSPGIFSAPVQISFSTLAAGDKVFYRAGAADGWHLFSAAFWLTNSSAVQFYGTNFAGARSQLLTANYFIASSVPPVSAYNLTNGTVFTNSGSGTFNPVVLSSEGTIFYGRKNTNGGSIWAINLDGSSETFVTTGARPRATRDGRYLAFSRGANVFGLQGGDVWIRDLQTGAEWELFTNQSATIFGYDWDLANPPDLILDSGCKFWTAPLSNSATVFQNSHDCGDSAPVVNPADGRVAFHNLTYSNTNLGGIYVEPANGGALQHLLAAGAPARWPAWSPDGAHLSFAFLNNAFATLGVSDIYTINADGTGASQITAFTNVSDGFKYGAIWSPATNALVGAGTINGTNGLWKIPLTADGEHCDCPAILLPTAAGDPIDFAGSVIVAPAPVVAAPGLFIRLEANAAVVYWSTNYQGFGLESTPGLAPDAAWSAVSGPYFLNGGYIEYHEARSALLAAKFFRLKYPTVIFLNPPMPQLSFSVQPPSSQAVLSWSTNYVGYTLETTTNLAAPIVWSPVADSTGSVTNGHIEFYQNFDSGTPRQFFRLRWP